MKRTRRNSGFSLVEMATVVGIVAILAALAYAALEVLPQRTRLTGGALEFAAVISSARSHAYGRNQRVAVLLNADVESAGKPIRYWVLVDKWSNLAAAMKAKPNWSALEDLLPGTPAPPGSEFPLFDSGNFNPSVRVVPQGFAHAVGRVAHKGCTAAMGDRIGLAQGQPKVRSDIFPPPFCFVPSEKGCTFCKEDGISAAFRGAIFFEPDGGVWFADSEGKPADVDGDTIPEGAASITFLPVGGGGLQSAQAIVITNTGLVRTFSAAR
ncbi:pilus assembly FimT family protein [Archangium lansingense]|uniref:Prepilin-type N-terminal cleavage/methylation domain-containing protein n=1 Tax=Archangium lansingense TaxID=2995310 RepID=A0ABT4A098_9BACT|nr:prepilin-type N-terminal cleavage/methylation domain-containing protein [Archangium lansinium]MCY1074719.1 prepilin-type N-terminal cleavage/methylation domain-containing protein [Archangium lansinium]